MLQKRAWYGVMVIFLLVGCSRHTSPATDHVTIKDEGSHTVPVQEISSQLPDQINSMVQVTGVISQSYRTGIELWTTPGVTSEAWVTLASHLSDSLSSHDEYNRVVARLTGEQIDLHILTGGKAHHVETGLEYNRVNSYTWGRWGSQIVFENQAYLASYIRGDDGVDVQREGEDLVLHFADQQAHQLFVYNPLDIPLRFSLGDQTSVYLGEGMMMHMVIKPQGRFSIVDMVYGDEVIHDYKIDFVDSAFRHEQFGYYLDDLRIYQGGSQSIYPGASYKVVLLGKTGLTSSSLSELQLYELDLTDDLLDKLGLELLADEELVADLGGKNFARWVRNAVATGQLASVGTRITKRLSAGSLELLFDAPEREGQYVLYMKDDQGYTYLIPLIVDGSFDFSYVVFPEQLKIHLEGRFAFDQLKLVEEFDRVFGSGGYKVDYLQPNLIEVSYYPLPGSSISDTIVVSNLYGDTASEEFQIVVDLIPEAFEAVELRGRALNLLPKYGYRGSHLEVMHHNVPAFTLYYQACDLAPPRWDQKDHWGYSYESFVFDCEGEVIDKKYDFAEQFAYRTPTVRRIETPKKTRSWHLFRVATDPRFEDSTYMIKSDIGIVTKVEPQQQLHLWAVGMAGGEMLSGGLVRILDGYTLEEVSSVPLTRGYAQLPLRDLAADILIAEVRSVEDYSFVVMRKDGAGWHYLTDGELFVDMSLASAIDRYELYAGTPQYRWGGGETTKIYGYTDRALYRAGDLINFAGFVRDLSAGGEATVLSGEVSVRLRDAQGGDMTHVEELGLDRYGGFDGAIELSEHGPLGVYVVEYIYNQSVVYTHDIRVEEFQKPSFEIKMNEYIEEGKVLLDIAPVYYFGAPLGRYDVSVEYTILSKEMCRDCRWQDDEEYYYNHLFEMPIESGGAISVLGATGSTKVPLVARELVGKYGQDMELRAEVRVRDHSTNETQIRTHYMDLQPAVRIGLRGQPVEWMYGAQASAYQVEGQLYQDYLPVDALVYEWYYQPYDHVVERGIDHNRYYIAGREYVLLTTGKLLGEEFELIPPFDQPGSYLLRLVAQNEQGNDLAMSHKRIEYYDWQGDQAWGYVGHLPNNARLIVDIPSQDYLPGEQIPIDIDPYISGARVIVTVERGTELLEVYQAELDGRQLRIPVKEDYHPNIHISVAQLAGEDLIATQERPEPRFFLGYAQVDISDELVELDLQVQTDKSTYLPGEMMRVEVISTDRQGRLVDTKLSVGVIDQSLQDLYRLIKEPIPYFYHKIGNQIGNYTTLKLLYQSLKVFAADGNKGGGGEGLFSQLSTWREQWQDLAYWSGSMIASGGRVSFSVQIPDNLTSREIDLIGISPDGQLGTTTHTVTVTQPLLVEANLPTFLTVGDEIDLPVKVLVDEGVLDRLEDKKIELAAHLVLDDGREIDLGSRSVSPDSQTRISLSVPDDIIGQERIELELVATAGGLRDAIRQSIPLRSDGFLVDTHHFTMQQQGQYRLLGSDQELAVADLEVRIGKVPVSAFEQPFLYLLRYPYGCTEQLVSSLYPLLAAKQLHDKGLLSDAYIRDGQAYLGSDEGRRDIELMVRDGVSRVLQHQQPDGGMAYWQGGKSIYMLSAYVYGALAQLEAQGYDVPPERLGALSNYLSTHTQTTDRERLYFWRHGAAVGGDLQPEQIVQLADQIAVDGKILAFASLVELGALGEARELHRRIDLDEIENLEVVDGVYLDRQILVAIYLKALVESHEKQRGGEARRLAKILLAQRDGDGLRGRSTQKNVQLLLAIASYIRSHDDSSGELVCEVEIAGQLPVRLKIPEGAWQVDHTIRLQNPEDVSVVWSCNQPPMIDLKAQGLPRDIDTIHTHLQQVSELNLTFDNETQIGDIVTVSGRYGVEKEAKHVAVEAFVPASFKFLHTIGTHVDSSDQFERSFGKSKQPIKFSGPECIPDHWEIRFDRVFIYHEQMRVGQVCEFELEALVSYAGDFHVMPMRLREMYHTDVWGRRVIGQ